MEDKRIQDMADEELILFFWGDNALNTIQSQETEPMTFDEFLNHCTACGGNWGGMLLTGIRELYPKVYDAIPDNMGMCAWLCIITTLNLLNIKQ